MKKNQVIMLSFAKKHLLLELNYLFYELSAIQSLLGRLDEKISVEKLRR